MDPGPDSDGDSEPRAKDGGPGGVWSPTSLLGAVTTAGYVLLSVSLAGGPRSFGIGSALFPISVVLGMLACVGWIVAVTAHRGRGLAILAVPLVGLGFVGVTMLNC